MFLLAFIPLFPKIPLFDILPGYIVRVRPEDVLVLCTALLWFREVRAKRISWNTSYFWFVLVYAASGLLSIVLGVFLLHTIPAQFIHISKSILHFVRYIEYFSVFFFFHSVIQTKKHVIIAFSVLILTLLGIIGYGIGQKYAHFPVYSTMNREYSKGEKLYLDNDARPQSTFAGPYDLSAFLVIVLPLLFSYALSILQNRKSFFHIILFTALQIIHILGLGMLILTGSAISLAGYLVAILFILLLHLSRLPTRSMRILWGGLALIMCFIGTVLIWIVMPQRIRDKTIGFLHVPTQRSNPTDLVGDGYETKTIQVLSSDDTVQTVTIREKSAWSENAIKYGISMGIRLDTLWPQAIMGFLRNPFSGSGYGTLAMLDSQKFMEADSTDNNYLRTLGETGLLGFVTFYGIVYFILQDLFKEMRAKQSQIAALSIGFSASTIGLLITATYLDVFAASKVAFVYWAIAGILLKNVQLHQTLVDQKEQLLKHVFAIKSHIARHWTMYAIIMLSFFLLHQNPYMNHNPTKDIESKTQELEQLATARCFLSERRFDLCRNSGLTLASHPSLYVALLIPLLAIFHQYGIFYYLNISIIFVVIFCTYVIMRRQNNHAQHIFVSLLCIPITAMLFGFTSAPLTDLHLFFIVIGLPSISFACLYLVKNRYARIFTSKKEFMAILFGIILVSILLSNITIRFRNISPNFAYQAIQIANNYISSAKTTSYLISVLNPYFVDLYSAQHYSLLPLSKAQTYASFPSKVWGFSNSAQLHQLYDSLLRFQSQLFVSDYGIYTKPTFINDFTELKHAYDLSYVALGCDEKCNVYAVQPAKPIVSNDIVSVFNGKKKAAQEVPSPYQFSIVSSRFDNALHPESQYEAPHFVSTLKPLLTLDNSFLFLTGDIAENDSTHSAKYVVDTVMNKVSYPVVYNAGNFDLPPKKLYPSEYQTFFTHTEYFIVLPVGQHSSLSVEHQLKLYTTLLQIEKMPHIKNLFIISHDLDWQNTKDSLNAMHVIEKKLQEFPYIHTYVITANHESNLLLNDSWYSTTYDKALNITYAASLVSGNRKDRYIQVHLNEKGDVKIEGKSFDQQ